jgi:hypothetical protein
MEKYQYFNGLKFTRDDKTGYYLNSTKRKRMHRYVWEYYNGAIPKGYEIHHKDGNKANNDISNLELLTAEAHQRYHAEHLTDEQRQKLAESLNRNARPAAIAWHKSAQGSEWHKKHYENTKEALHLKTQIICENCGAEFIGALNSKFCCNACKSAYRRKIGADNIESECPICNKLFYTNKFAPAETCSRSCANRLRAKKRNESCKSRIA